MKESVLLLEVLEEILVQVPPMISSLSRQCYNTLRSYYQPPHLPGPDLQGAVGSEMGL